jgi:carbamoyltransferase
MAVAITERPVFEFYSFMSLILGLNAFHPDASVCLLADGKLVAAVAEERLRPRLKHVAGFPGRALNAILRMAVFGSRDVRSIAIGNDNNTNIPEKGRRVLVSPLESSRSDALSAPDPHAKH